MNFTMTILLAILVSLAAGLPFESVGEKIVVGIMSGALIMIIKIMDWALEKIVKNSNKS